MKKLSDEQISRVLSEAAIGRLEHFDDCRCVAHAATTVPAPWSHRDDGYDEWWGISQAAGRGWEFRYPKGPDAVLRMLEGQGLA